MLPILGRYGPFFLYSYQVVMGVGLAAGLGLTAWRARKVGAERWPGWLDATLVGLGVGLVGGRAVFVATHWAYFAENPGEMGLVWRGGLSYHGVFVAGLLGMWGWLRWQERSFAPYADLLAPALALASSFGWLACYLAACAYGRETSLGWLAADRPDSYGVYAVRYQTQLLGLALTLPLVPLLWRWREKWRDGRLFWLALGWLSGGRLLVSLWRGDEMLLIGRLRLDTLSEIILTLISCIVLAVYHSRYVEERNKHPEVRSGT